MSRPQAPRRLRGSSAGSAAQTAEAAWRWFRQHHASIRRAAHAAVLLLVHSGCGGPTTRQPARPPHLRRAGLLHVFVLDECVPAKGRRSKTQSRGWTALGPRSRGSDGRSGGTSGASCGSRTKRQEEENTAAAGPPTPWTFPSSSRPTEPAAASGAACQETARSKSSGSRAPSPLGHLLLLVQRVEQPALADAPAAAQDLPGAVQSACGAVA